MGWDLCHPSPAVKAIGQRGVSHLAERDGARGAARMGAAP